MVVHPLLGGMVVHLGQSIMPEMEDIRVGQHHAMIDTGLRLNGDRWGVAHQNQHIYHPEQMIIP